MIDHFWTFFVAITLLTLFPGVDSLLVIRNSARGGWQDGLATSTGICCGLFVHASVSALGISALLLQSAVAFSLLKLIGGGYLLWLGGGNLWQALRRPQANISTPQALPQRSFSLPRSLRDGLLCNVCNPKTLLFYMAFLPQFIDPTRSPLLQSLFMAAVHFAIAMVYQGGLVLVTCRVKGWLVSGRLSRLLEGATGLLLLGFGMKVLLERRL